MRVKYLTQPLRARWIAAASMPLIWVYGNPARAQFTDDLTQKIPAAVDTESDWVTLGAGFITLLFAGGVFYYVLSSLLSGVRGTAKKVDDLADGRPDANIGQILKMSGVTVGVVATVLIVGIAVYEAIDLGFITSGTP